MSSRDEQSASSVQYEPHENPPALVSLGSGLQLVVLGITSIIFIPTIIIRVSGGTDAYLSWAVFGAVAVSGVCTALQAVRLSRVGAGYLLFMGPAGAFIGVCVSALNEGGPPLLATLVVASSLVPIVISMRLALFRRLLTPTIVGTVNMLIPATVLPVVFSRLADAPPETALSAPLTAVATGLVIGGISLKAGATLRLWAPLIGVIAGSVIGGSMGLYDFDLIARAPWIGLPPGRLAGNRARPRPGLCGTPACLRVRFPHRRYPDDHRCGRHPARVVAPAAGRGLPGGGGCSNGGRHR